MIPRPRTIAGVVFLLAACGSATHARSATEAEAAVAPASMTTSAAKDAVVATMPSVAQIRGLEFKQPVPVEVVGDSVTRQHALKRLEMYYEDEMIRGMQTAYIRLGLLPEGTDVLAEFLGVLEEQAGGFYDPSTKAFFLLDDMPAGVAPMLAAHELTHALEDQHFDLDARLMDALPNDDHAFAVGAVHEGSAMLVMSLYVLRAMADGTLTQENLAEMAESDAARGEKLAALAPALQRPFIAAYVLGMTFLLRGDPSAMFSGYPVEDVNECERGGPTSSEQILHPEKYWDPERRDPPVAVEPFDTRKALGRRWKRSASGVLGEIVIGVMVGAPTPKGLAGMSQPDPAAWTNSAAAGWGGDRWELWRRGDRELVLLWTVWDTEQDAGEFAAALGRQGGDMVWETRGKRVAIVAGDVPERADRLFSLLLGEE
jgi:hypothetical protein